LRKFLVIATAILLSQQILSAKPLFKEYNTKILSINGRTATIKNSSDIVLGSSGIVVHTFKDDLSTIVARIDVISKNADKATVRFEVFSMLAQKAFPKPGIVPQIGDEIKLNYLYDRALIVTPNYDVYKEVTNHFKDMQWIHPDIVAAYLAKTNRPNPNKEIFQKVCHINSASLIFFALNDSGYFVDCNNFKTIKRVNTGKIKIAQVPFYSRVKNITTNWLNWDSSYITDYNRYYRNIIGK